MISGDAGEAMASGDVHLDVAKDSFSPSLRALMKISTRIGCSTTVPRALKQQFDLLLEFKPNDIVCVVLSPFVLNRCVPLALLRSAMVMQQLDMCTAATL